MMFEHLSGYRGIIVTGPHRSGTTICGRMIAYDLDRRYVTETQVQIDRGRNIDADYMRQWMKSQSAPWVLHGATCFAWIEQMQGDDIATMLVRRPLAEIRASQGRAKRVIDDPEAKWDRWDEMAVSGVIRHPFEVQYHDLKAHPLWVDDRAGWDIRQISATETAFDTAGGR